MGCTINVCSKPRRNNKIKNAWMTDECGLNAKSKKYDEEVWPYREKKMKISLWENI